MGKHDRYISYPAQCMMTLSSGNIFRVTGPFCGEFTGPGEFPAQRPVTRSFDVFVDLRLRISDWVNNREAGDLRGLRGHYDVIVMCCDCSVIISINTCKQQTKNFYQITDWNVDMKPS